jgi:hypothetical protein
MTEKKSETKEKEYATKEEVSDGLKAVADVLNKIDQKDERPINVDVRGRKKRTRTSERQDKLNRANKAMEERVPLTIPSPVDDKEAARGFHTVTTNGKNWRIQFDRKVMVPKYVAAAYNESMRLEREATERRRKVLRQQAAKISKL